MSPWNPDQYLKFKDERTQPVRDLAARIFVDGPRRIADLGCGPGNSTQVLRERWPGAEIVGVDNSEAMIAEARSIFPGERWLLADIRDWRPNEEYDVLFSAATLQWISEHDRLIPRLFSYIRKSGALAVQLPANQDSPLHRALLRVSRRGEWLKWTAGSENLIVYRTPDFYYEILSALSPQVQLWKTTYYHALESHSALIEWYSSTGMRPFLERLPNEELRAVFRRQVLEECRESYPVQKDGRILLPFCRLFFVVSTL